MRAPRNAGELASPDGVGRAGHGDHEYAIVHIRVREDVIVEIAQRAVGCEPALAAASMVTQLALGQHLDDAAHITQDTIVSALGGLPPDKRHTAGMAAEALAAAIMDYVVRHVEQQQLSPQPIRVSKTRRSQRTQRRRRDFQKKKTKLGE